MHVRKAIWLTLLSETMKNMKELGNNFYKSSKWLVSLVILSGLGCGGRPPESAETQQSNPNTSSSGVAEVEQSFSGFDSGVEEKGDTSPKPAASASQESPANPGPTKAAPPKPSVAAPTAEQLKRWAVKPYERLQLLACRDSGHAGFLTRAVRVGEEGAYALAGNRLTAWALDKDEPTRDFSDPANEQVIKAFDAALDGKWLASGDGKGNLQIWDWPDCKQRLTKQIYPSGVAHLSISPDSTSIATASFTGEVTIWDATQLTVKNKFTVATQGLQGLLFIAPNRIAIAAQASSIWNTESGEQEHLLTAGGYHSTFALSADGKRLAYSNEGKIEFWNIQDGKTDGALSGSFSRNDLAAFSPDGKFLATASKFIVQIWDIASSQLVQVIDTFGWEASSLNWLPKSSLLMIASQNGRVRFWGSTSSGVAVGWKPLHGPIEMPRIDSGESASPAQLIQVVDIRTLPRLPGATTLAANDMLVNYNTSATVDEAKVFYHFHLTRDGWTQSFDSATAADAMNFEKQGFGLSLYFSPSADGMTQVNLTTAGNVDLRGLPKFDSTPPQVDYEADNAVMYRVKDKLLDVETTLLRKFFDAGWTAYARLNASKNEPADGRDLNFVRGATTVLVSIQRQPADPTSYHVRYSKFINTKSLPIPKDSGFIEFDGSTQPLMVASTAMTLEQTRDFYDKEMTAQGWLRRDSGKQFKDKTGWMDFIRGQCDVSIVLVALDSGRTQIRVGEGLENSSWQLQKVKQPDPKVASNGIEAADIPALNGWSIVKYDAEQKQIDLVAKGATTFAVAEAYGKELAAQGWKTDGSGVKSDDYLLAEFTKEKIELTLRATLRGGEIQASLSGDGLLWNKPLPVAKQAIAYETWLRIHQYPTSLELLDQYIAEMKAIQQPQ
jgi:WD40 repeat protein